MSPLRHCASTVSGRRCGATIFGASFADDPGKQTQWAAFTVKRDRPISSYDAEGNSVASLFHVW